MLPQPRAWPRTARPQTPRVVGGHRTHYAIATATRRQRPSRYAARTTIPLRVGGCIKPVKMAKHFALQITNGSRSRFTRSTGRAIPAEATLDGIYVLRTSLPDQTLHHRRVSGCATKTSPTSSDSSAPSTPSSTSAPSGIGLADRVRATCSYGCCSYYLIWHMKRPWPQSSSCDNDKPAADSQTRRPRRRGPSAPITRWPKQPANAPPTNTPVDSFRPGLLEPEPAATICAPTTSNPPTTCRPPPWTTTPPLQRRTFELLDVSRATAWVRSVPRTRSGQQIQVERQPSTQRETVGLEMGR